jgi:hypothetical protein
MHVAFEFWDQISKRTLYADHHRIFEEKINQNQPQPSSWAQSEIPSSSSHIIPLNRAAKQTTYIPWKNDQPHIEEPSEIYQSFT